MTAPQKSLAMVAVGLTLLGCGAQFGIGVLAVFGGAFLYGAAMVDR